MEDKTNKKQKNSTGSSQNYTHNPYDTKIEMYGQKYNYHQITTHNDYVDYFMKRYMEQVIWYDKKAVINKNLFMWYQRIVIFLGALIPIIVAVGGYVPAIKEYSGLMSAIISGVIAVVAALDKLQQPMSNWYNYRNIAENLKKEQYYYDFKIPPYQGLNEMAMKRLFVERIEGTVASDINRFLQGVQNQDDEDDNPTDDILKKNPPPIS
ncbi:DUF4231 domain-containing protein [Bernardetia sp. ABR2-2B]|uniref:DUF4231 domain-containing protein n=1 Tax=Bernardetia sp. ABR2-2B TaxID=3127472 RepID=UPI0030D2C75E